MEEQGNKSTYEAFLHELLEHVSQGMCTVENAVKQLKDLPFVNLGYAHVDHHRAVRLGFPEVVFGSAKSAPQIIGIANELAKHGQNILITRVFSENAEEVKKAIPQIEHHPLSGSMILRQHEVAKMGHGSVLIVTAGTGDMPVAEEAILTTELMGNHVEQLFDVGVAGIHRLLNYRSTLESASVIIVVAGMEGALPSVVGGLVARPIIAVPTSVGYGASFGGLAALLGMLNSCAAGVTVVNIDNGFGAGYAASMINRK